MAARSSYTRVPSPCAVDVCPQAGELLVLIGTALMPQAYMYTNGVPWAKSLPMLPVLKPATKQ